MKNQLTKEFFEKQYVENLLTDKEIGELVDLPTWKVKKIRNKLGVKGIYKANNTTGNRRKYDVGIYGDLTAHNKYKVGKLWFFNLTCRCGNSFTARVTHVGMGKTKSCGCLIKELGKKKRTGFGDITGDYWGNLKRNALSRNLSFDITPEYGWELYKSQEGRCSLSGESIHFTKGNHTASLDRIDSTKGYIKGNVQWVHKIVNKMKMNLSDKEFIKWCTYINEYRS